MTNQSYIRVLTALELFSKEHLQVKRFASDFPEQLPNFSSETEQYPILFVSPTNSIFKRNQNTFELTIYCYDLIQDGRDNINTILSDTNTILNDLYLWLRDGDVGGLEIMNDINCIPINNALLDYVAGWQMNLTIEADTYNVCEIPFNDEPVILDVVNNIIYSKYLTCETLSECGTIVDIENELSGLISNKTDVIGTGNSTNYPSTKGVVDYVSDVEDNLVNYINLSKQDTLTEDNFGEFMDVDLATKLTPSPNDTILGRDFVTNKVVELNYPIVEGYFNGTNFYLDSSFVNLIQATTGRVCINLSTNLQYRWTGSVYVQIGGALETDPIFLSSEASNFVVGDKANLDNQIGINTGDETSSTIQTKRPLKTVTNKSLEGTGNIGIDYNDLDNLPVIPTIITNHSGLSLDDGTNPHGTTKGDVGLSNVPNLDTTESVNNEHTHSNKTILDNTTESFITALKNAYDGAVSWITTNGTNLINHLSNNSNPHNVTKSQVGLSNVDNTSDVDKPISTATQTALNSKLDKNTTAGVLRFWVYGTDGIGSEKPISEFGGREIYIKNISVSGGYTIDFNVDTHRLTLTGNTTFSEINLPPVGFSKTITLHINGNFGVVFPASWTQYISGSYNGTATLNTIVIETIGTERKVQISQPD